MDTKEQVIEKVKKILAKADPTRNDCEAEVENAMRIAKRLMAEHDIEMTDVEVDEEDGSESFDFCNEQCDLLVRGSLVGTVARAVRYITNTDCFRTSYYKGTKKFYKMTFCGTRTDVAVAKMMYGMLWEMMKERARAVAREHGCSSDRSFIRSYETGFSSGLVKNASEDVVFEDQKKNECYALMVVNKEQALSNWMKQEHSDLRTIRTGSGVRNINTEAYHRGYSDGKAVNLKAKGWLK